MLEKYLDEAILAIDKIVSVTDFDMQNIKLARHDHLSQSIDEKTSLIKEFERLKCLIDKELVKMVANNENTDLSDILSFNEKSKLDKLRASLIELKTKNKNYAKSLIVVKEFYDSLAKKVLFKDDSSYAKNPQESEYIFKVRV